MSRRRSRERNLAVIQPKSINNQPVVRPPAQSLPRPVVVEMPARKRFWTWLGEKHQHIASYSALGGVIAAFFALYFQWSQQKDSDNQLAVLRKAFEQQHAHELAPRLLVDCPVDRIKISEDGQLVLQEAQIRIRNIGKGTAHHIVATVDFLRLDVDDGKEHDDDWKVAFPTQTVIAQKTLPSGESLPFNHFSYPLFKSIEPQALTGTIGIYSVDDEGHEVVQTQRFMIVVHLEQGNAQARLDFMTPKVRPETFASRTGKNERTLVDAEGILKFVVTNEHDYLRKFAEETVHSKLDN
jgi:hypothetical protein